MAAPIQQVVGDLGSQEFLLVRRQVNLCVNTLLAIQAAVAASGTYAALQTAVAAIDMTALRQILETREPPSPREFPLG
jgi:hypothetical protein